MTTNANVIPILQEPAVLVKTEIDEGNAAHQEMISGRERRIVSFLRYNHLF